MTAVQMLARLRTLLDETPEGFWDDDVDCYPALTDAQVEVARLLVPKKSSILANIKESLSQTALTPDDPANEVDLPPDFLFVWSLKAHPTGGTQRPCIERQGGRYEYEDNPYLSSENDSLLYELQRSKLIFDIDFAAGALTLDYIRKPLDIAGATDTTEAQDAEIDSRAHMSIVYGAWAFLLNKAKLPSDGAYKIFYQTVATL